MNRYALLKSNSIFLLLVTPPRESDDEVLTFGLNFEHLAEGNAWPANNFDRNSQIILGLQERRASDALVRYFRWARTRHCRDAATH